MSPLTEKILAWFDVGGLKRPDFWHAMGFAETERAEALEVIFSREGGWVRNHPENKPEWDREAFGKELGQAVMMIVMAGIAEGIDPLESLDAWLGKKIASAK